MDIQKELTDIWSQKYIKNLPDFISERGFIFAQNACQKDFLITGINPSFRKEAELGNFSYDFQDTMKIQKYDNYWGPLKKMLFSPEDLIDLRSETAYLDIFYFREMSQEKIKKEIHKNKDGIKFLTEQLHITQHIIENIIKPKVIIVKNKESAAYWGKFAETGIIWMGYKLIHLENIVEGELFKISGFVDSNERISPDLPKTNLVGSVVLIMEHITRFTKKEKRPTAQFIKNLLNVYEEM